VGCHGYNIAAVERHPLYDRKHPCPTSSNSAWKRVFPSLMILREKETSARSCLPVVSIHLKVWTEKYPRSFGIR